MSRSAWVPVTILAVALSGSACRRPAASPVARHVVIVTIDTLRADRLGCYGRDDVETPHLDRIAAEGALAPEATSHVPLTRPSHVSLFTGLLPFAHGVRDNLTSASVPDVPLLAEVLKRQGFTTAAFLSSVVLSSHTGLNRGFDVYSDPLGGAAPDVDPLRTAERRGTETIAEALKWLEAHRSGRVFLWLHLYEPHDPYQPPEPYLSRYAGRLYDGEVAWTDELIGRFDQRLAALGLKSDTLLVVTSDHGEGLGDHGETLHGFLAYQSTLRVPFIARGPGIVPGLRLPFIVRLVDVFPTALDLAGLAAPADAQLSGHSLATALRGGSIPPAPVTYAETLVPLLHFGWSDLRVIRDDRWKYIQAPRPELYDLVRDPDEQHNLAGAERSRAAAMRSTLARFLEQERAAQHGTAERTVPAELLEKIGALGYIGVGSPADTTDPGADPKDKMEEFRQVSSAIRDALLALHAGNPNTAIAKLRSVIALGVHSFEIHYYLGRALLAVDRPAEAVSHFQEATRRAPTSAPSWEGLAECRVRLKDPAGALEVLRDGQRAGVSTLQAREASLLRQLGQTTAARQAYESALTRDPGNAQLHAELGELLRDHGQVDEALRHLRTAVELAPSGAAYWNVLGMTLGGNRRPREAETAFREALKLEPGNHQHAYNLGLLLLREGRKAEARRYFEQAVALQPRFAPARESLAGLRNR